MENASNTETPSSVKFDAFISYRHTPLDRHWAKWLHGALETYRIPRRLLGDRRGARRLHPIFRDEEELQASPNLSHEIQRALFHSRFLVVICSPSTPESIWVAKEILFFRKLGRDKRILSLLIDGTPDESFPRPLREIRSKVVGRGGKAEERIEKVEPLAADVRSGRGESNRHLRRMAKLRILACILGVGFDDLRRRDVERQRRRMTIGASVAFVFLAVIGVLGAFTWQANRLADLERTNRQQADTIAAQKIKEAAKYQEEANKQKSIASQSKVEEIKQTSLAAQSKIEADKQAALAAQRKIEAATQTFLAEANKLQAEKNAKAAELERKNARWPQYVADMQKIPAAFDLNDTRTIDAILNRQKSRPGDEDLRGIEWYYWTRHRQQGVHIETGMGSWCRGLAISPDGKWVALTDRINAGVWNLETGKISFKGDIVGGLPIVNFGGSRNWDQSVAFSPDGAYVAAATALVTRDGQHGAFKVWQTDTGKEVLAIHDDKLVSGRAVAFSPDGADVVAGGYSGSWKSWNLTSRNTGVSALQAEPGRVSPLAVTSGAPVISLVFLRNKSLVSQCTSGPVAIWEWPSGSYKRGRAAVGPIPGRGGGSRIGDDHVSGGITLESGGSELIVAWEARRVEILSNARWERKQLGDQDITCLGGEGQQLVAGCSDGIVRMWSLSGDSGAPLRAPIQFRGCDKVACVATAGRKVAAVDGQGVIRAWPLEENSDAVQLPVTTARPENGLVRTSADGLLRAGWKRDKQFVIEEIASGKTRASIDAPQDPIAMLFSPGDRYAALSIGDLVLGAGGLRNTRKPPRIQVLNLTSGKLEAEIELPMRLNGTQFSFNRNGNLICALLYNKGITVVQCDGGSDVLAINEPRAHLARMSPAGNYVAVSGAGFTQLWDVGKKTKIFENETAAREMVFDSKEENLLLNTARGVIKVNVAAGTSIDAPFLAGDQVVFSEDGRRAYVAARGLLQVMSSDGGAKLAEIPCTGTPDTSRLEAAVQTLVDQWKQGG